jgi:hypothetical protein
MITNQISHLISDDATYPWFEGARLVPHVPLFGDVGFYDLLYILKVKPFNCIKAPLRSLLLYGDINYIREIFVGELIRLSFHL